jgi:HD-GYP domain-containing protein (c-di-GMP phosphodiesterase class II)
MISSTFAGDPYERLLRHACRLQRVDEACLLLDDPQRPGRCAVVAGHGIDPDLLGRRLPAGARRRPASVSGLPGGARALVLVDGRVRGVLVLGPPVGELRGPDLLDELAALVGTVVGQLDRGAPLRAGSWSPDDPPAVAGDTASVGLQSDVSQEIALLVAALQAADDHTEGHCQRVATLASDVGRELDLDAGDRLELDLTARLHDVGKLRLPRAILDKPGPLDARERRLVRMHPGWGAEIVARIPGLAAVALLVWLHHERVDGRGYPHGLTGERIPLASRIVAVCDAHGAIVDDRPYRAGRSSDEALEELYRHAGTQFDPDVVDALERTLMAAVV